jgi:DNA primase
MSTPGLDGVAEYYRLVRELDIGQIAKELLPGKITVDSATTLQCDCPNHQSQSRKSLQVMLDKQGWYCFGCGVGGDVLQLAEFIRSGKVTAGVAGPMPESHREARDFLAEKAGLPPLSRYGMTDERLQQTEEDHAFRLRVQEALTSVAAYYHARLLENKDALEWMRSNYGLQDEIVERLKIGYADNEPGILAHLLEEHGGKFSKRELAATGLFRPTSQDGLSPFFDKRLMFPYWSHGSVVFFIGRKTPWTPDSPWEQGKYKKLPVHDQHQRPFIAKFINNGVLYNQDVLLSRPESVVITEGVTDCLALMQQGFKTISPVTVRIKAADWQHLMPRLRGVQKVFICQDNEISQAGLKGALQTARILAEHKVETRLVTLPLDDEQKQARARLKAEFGLVNAVGPKELASLLEGRSAQDVTEAQRLLSASKIDVNEFFIRGHSAQDFQKLLDCAQSPIEYGIQNIPDDLPEEERNKILDPVLAEMATMPPLEQSRLLKQLHERLGRAIPMNVLKEQLRSVRQEEKAKARQESKKAKRKSDAPPGSCRARVEEVLLETELEDGNPDHSKAAEAAYEWFTANGAMFFHTQLGEPFMYFDNAIYWMDSPDRGRKRQYAAMLYKNTGLVPTSGGGRTFFEVLPSLAMIRGQVRDHFSWLHSNVSDHTVYFNLNNPDHEIAKITPDGIEILRNGGNLDGIILDGSRKMKPLRFIPDADLEEADRLLVDLLISNMSCPMGDRFLILSWLSCFLLIDFAGTRPMTRFEGSAGSGKTTASKLISALLYGEPQHKKATDAANYTDGSQNPLIVLDNIEVKQMTEDLTTFMLTSITGIAKEKRKSGTDSETVTERTKCLLNTTGIEPLLGELSEIQSRTFVINFDIDNQSNGCFIESEAVALLEKNRDLIISAMMKRTSYVLGMMRDGRRTLSMKLIHEQLGSHDKRRCNEYLSLMYLMMLAGSSQDEIEEGLAELSPEFVKQISNVNQTSRETSRDSNPISMVLGTLFNAWKAAEDADRHEYMAIGKPNNVAQFIQKFQVQFEKDGSLGPILSRDLFVALKRISRDFGLVFNLNSSRQFAQRFANDLEIIKDSGFAIKTTQKRYGTKIYEIRVREDQG